MANTRAFGRPDYPYFRDWIISWLSTVAIRTSEEDPVHHFRLIRPDLKIWNAPSHSICILRRFQCSPLPPLSTAPNPGVASFHRPCSMQITIFPCYSFGYEKYMPFLDQNNLLLPPRTCFPAFSTPLFDAPVQFPISRRRCYDVGGRSLRFPKIIIARIKS